LSTGYALPGGAGLPLGGDAMKAIVQRLKNLEKLLKRSFIIVGGRKISQEEWDRWQNTRDEDWIG